MGEKEKYQHELTAQLDGRNVIEREAFVTFIRIVRNPRVIETWNEQDRPKYREEEPWNREKKKKENPKIRNPREHRRNPKRAVW